PVSESVNQTTKPDTTVAIAKPRPPPGPPVMLISWLSPPRPPPALSASRHASPQRPVGSVLNKGFPDTYEYRLTTVVVSPTPARGSAVMNRPVAGSYQRARM